MLGPNLREEALSPVCFGLRVSGLRGKGFRGLGFRGLGFSPGSKDRSGCGTLWFVLRLGFRV